MSEFLKFLFLNFYSDIWRVGHNGATSLSIFTFMHWRRKWQPTPVFLPGESQGQGSLLGCRLWGRTQLTWQQQQQLSLVWYEYSREVRIVTAKWLRHWTWDPVDLYPRGFEPHFWYNGSCFSSLRRDDVLIWKSVADLESVAITSEFTAWKVEKYTSAWSDAT